MTVEDVVLILKSEMYGIHGEYGFQVKGYREAAAAIMLQYEREMRAENKKSESEK